ncbi:PfkB family carbohydrate kinase [Brachybacterium nesterenkovii]|uniref:PfkB family carbohydrate kinase n=1 Tax=Brachybacterium nesterenkovii TaxID=47847 RepID=UPI00321BFF84
MPADPNPNARIHAVHVLGSLNADMTLAVPRIVRPGETLSATSSTLSPGGKGMNQAVAAAHSGARRS